MRNYGKNCITAKLTKDNGATMVFALVVFLIAAMMSMVIVNAALGNAARLRRQYEKRQAMLAMTSAENLLEGMIHGMTVRKNKSGGWEVEYGDSALAKAGTGDQLKDKITGLLSGTGTATLHITSSVASSDGAGQSGQADPLAVDIEIKRNPDYSLEAKVKKASNSGNVNTGTAEDDNSSVRTYMYPAIAIEINEKKFPGDDEGEGTDTTEPNYIKW